MIRGGPLAVERACRVRPPGPPHSSEEDSELKILAHVHGYPPAHNAGAEHMVHAMLSWFAARGHDCRVLVQRAMRGSFAPAAWPLELDGVRIRAAGPVRWTERAYREADVVFTHLDCSPSAQEIARKTGTPLVHVVHNHLQLVRHQIRPELTGLVVFNSEWLRDEVAVDGAHDRQREVKLPAWPGRHVVCRPPVWTAGYSVPAAGDAVTLINLQEAKGFRTWYRLAARCPRRRFLGVIGAYGHQELPAALRANVEVVQTATDVREIYARTRVLLMPSSYESWGRCAIEAAASGIPTIAHPTPGLLESLGEAGIFAHRDDLEAWMTELVRLDDDQEYSAQAERSRRRAAELERIATADLEALEGELADVVSTFTPPSTAADPAYSALRDGRGEFLAAPRPAGRRR